MSKIRPPGPLDLGPVPPRREDQEGSVESIMDLGISMFRVTLGLGARWRLNAELDPLPLPTPPSPPQQSPPPKPPDEDPPSPPILVDFSQKCPKDLDNSRKNHPNQHPGEEKGPELRVEDLGFECGRVGGGRSSDDTKARREEDALTVLVSTPERVIRRKNRMLERDAIRRFLRSNDISDSKKRNFLQEWEESLLNWKSALERKRYYLTQDKQQMKQQEEVFKLRVSSENENIFYQYKEVETEKAELITTRDKVKRFLREREEMWVNDQKLLSDEKVQAEVQCEVLIAETRMKQEEVLRKEIARIEDENQKLDEETRAAEAKCHKELKHSLENLENHLNDQIRTQDVEFKKRAKMIDFEIQRKKEDHKVRLAEEMEGLKSLLNIRDTRMKASIANLTSSLHQQRQNLQSYRAKHPIHVQEQQIKIDNLKGKVEEIRAEISRLAAEENEAKSSIRALQDRNSTLQASLDTAREAASQATKLWKETKKQVEELEIEKSQLIQQRDTITGNIEVSQTNRKALEKQVQILKYEQAKTSDEDERISKEDKLLSDRLNIMHEEMENKESTLIDETEAYNKELERQQKKVYMLRKRQTLLEMRMLVLNVREGTAKAKTKSLLHVLADRRDSFDSKASRETKSAPRAPEILKLSKNLRANSRSEGCISSSAENRVTESNMKRSYQ
ncbi:hypothetical protein AAMO2058_001539900 [Amorphochlora amoebiformis]